MAFWTWSRRAIHLAVWLPGPEGLIHALGLVLSVLLAVAAALSLPISLYALLKSFRLAGASQR